MAQKRKPTEHKTASSRVYEQVRDRISSGVYKVGERLTESALAEHLRVSRTPVREALHRLASEGFMELSPHAGALVKGWSQRDVREVFQIRAHLESMAAGLAARHATPEDVVRLAEYHDAMERLSQEQSRDVPKISEINRAFHAEILRIADNKRMADIALNLMDLGFLVHSYTQFGQENILRSSSDHRCLVEAIRQGDERWAEAIMRSHILAAASIFTGTDGEEAEALARTHSPQSDNIEMKGTMNNDGQA